MSRFNELGVDIGQFSKLTRTELHTINNHVTPWSAEELSDARKEAKADAEKVEAQAEEDRKNRSEGEPEGEPEGGLQTLHKSSYYGDHVNIGPGQRPEPHERKYNVAVAFIVQPDVPGLESLPEITSLQINGPRVCMTTAEVRTFTATVAAAADHPVAQPTASSAAQPVNSVEALAKKLHANGGQLHEPSDNDIFKQTHYFTAKHPELQPLAVNKVGILRDYMRFELFWKISEKRLRGVLFKTSRVLSYGMIPVSRPPLPSLHVVFAKPESFKQEDCTRAEFIIHEDQRDRTYMRLRTTHQYKDEATPSVQPCVKTDVDFTFRNTRPAGDVAEVGGVYKPSHRIFDVSDASATPVLQALYPHLAEANATYWEQMYASLAGGRTLVLIKLHHNEHPCTSNLFTFRPEASPSHKHLHIVMRHAPTVFLLVRDTHVNLVTESAINRFVELGCYNPHSAFYVDKMNPLINDKGIMPMNKLPRFTVLPENSFEDWDEFAVYAGVGTIIKHRFSMRNQIHRGRASAQPVPYSQLHDGLSLALCLQFSEEDRQPDVPRLTAGDAVAVDFYHYKGQVCSKHLWKGKVVAPGIITADGQVCIVVHRPVGAKGVLDDKPHTTLTATDLNGMATEDLQAWARDNTTLQITVFKDNDDKELERLTDALDKMKVCPAEIVKYAGKERVLEELRKLFLCKDHEMYSKKSLYHDVHKEDREKFVAILPSLLKDYQLHAVESWINGGVLANTAILGGISGSGKTYTSMVALCAFLFRCFVDPAIRNMRLHEMANVFQDPSLAPALTEHLPPHLDKGKGRAEFAVEPVAGESVAAELVAAETPPANFTHEETAEYKEGLITHACFQNETVDHSYDQLVKILTKVCEMMDVPMKLVIRCHSIQTEQKALMAMLDPEFDLTFDVDAPKKDPMFIKRSDLLKGDTVEHLLNHYLRHFQSKFDGITDRRFQVAEGSVARVILQLARFPPVEISNEVVNTWTEAERDDIAAQLQPILDAAIELRAKPKMSAEVKQEVLETFKIGFDIVMQRAPVVCCTASVANSSNFQLIRQANAVCIEEAGRGTDMDLMGFFSNYWDAQRFVVGCWNQLGPNSCGPRLGNPFQAQLSTPPLARFHMTGFPIEELTQTSRFTNQEMLGLCQTLNNAPNVTEVPGSFNDAMEQEARAVNFRIWGIRHAIVAVNVKDVTTSADSNGSHYCTQTAVVAMHDLTNRLRHQPGHHILVITPYNAQVRILSAFRDAAVQKAIQAGDRKLAKELIKVMITTVDSSMGKDRHVTILDTVGHDKGFFWLQPRTLVAGTRAKTSLVFIGPTYEYTTSSHIDPKNRLKKALYEWDSGKKIASVKKHKFDTFEQYHSVQVALGLTSDK